MPCLTIEVFVCYMMLCVWDSNVGIGVQHMKMQMIHIIIHVHKEEQYTNYHCNLKKQQYQHINSIALSPLPVA